MRKVLPPVAIVLALCGIAQAIVNIQVTPRQLVDNAGGVVVATLVKEGQAWKLQVVDAVKGDASGVLSIDLTRCDKEQLEEIAALLGDNVSKPAVLITSRRFARGNLHVGGTWMEVVGGGKEPWHVTKMVPELTGTFSGGTDMLARMLRHLADHPDAMVPSTVGVKWADNCVAGNVPGATALAAIEWPEAGKPALFVASPKGDRLLASKAKENAFADVTAAAGLTSKSALFAFVDVNGDGLADLVSYDGSAVDVYLGGKEFKPAGPQWHFKLDGCIGLSPCSMDGHAGVLLSTGGAPVLLVAMDRGWKPVPLTAFAGNIGHVSPCVVADLDNDGYVDVLQPGETGGVLWKGSRGGFDAPVRSAVCTGGGVARAAVADFNEDGFADIFLSGAEKNSLWENDVKGGFADVLPYAGSLNAKCPPNASAVLAVDLNHDGRADLCIGYATGEMLYHYNRGYRTLAEERELRLPGTEPKPGMEPAGLLSFATADFNGDNSADLAVLQSDGTVRVYFNDRVDSPALMLRLPAGVAGPVTVSCWTDEKIPSPVGFAVVTSHTPGVYLPIREKGVVNVRWRFPGEPPMSMAVKVGDGVSEATLKAKGE